MLHTHYIYIYALSICAAIAWWLKGLKESWTTINLNMNPYQGLNKSHWTVGVYLLGYPTIYESWVLRFHTNMKYIFPVHGKLHRYLNKHCKHCQTQTAGLFWAHPWVWLTSKLSVILFRACYTPHAASLLPLNPALQTRGACDRSSPVRCCRCSRCPPSWCRCWCGRPGAETGQTLRKKMALRQRKNGDLTTKVQWCKIEDRMD